MMIANNNVHTTSTFKPSPVTLETIQHLVLMATKEMLDVPLWAEVFSFQASRPVIMARPSTATQYLQPLV